MAATLTMVPLAKIKPRDGFNPRGVRRRADGRAASVKQHGIITPLTLAPDGDGFVIVAGRAPLPGGQAGEAQGGPPRCGTPTATRSLAVAENVIRADLNPVEEARAYERLVAEHGDAAKVAKLVGRSEKLLGERLDLRAARGSASAARRPPVPRLRARAPHRGRTRSSPTSALSGSRTDPRPPRGSRPIPARSWTTCSRPSGRTTTASRSTRSPTASAAVGRSSRRPQPGRAAPAHPREARRARRAGRRRLRGATEIPQEDEYDWQARQAVEQRERECFALNDEDADAARAFGCLLDLSARTDATTCTSPTASGSRIGSSRRSPPRRRAEEERKEREREARSPSASQDDAEKARREQRRGYEARVAGRARNLDLGAALTRWQPKLDTDAVKLLGSLVLLHYGKAAAWAHRLCVEQPTTTNKQGKVSVRPPRGAQAEAELHGERPSA